MTGGKWSEVCLLWENGWTQHEAQRRCHNGLIAMQMFPPALASRETFSRWRWGWECKPSAPLAVNLPGRCDSRPKLPRCDWRKDQSLTSSVLQSELQQAERQAKRPAIFSRVKASEGHHSLVCSSSAIRCISIAIPSDSVSLGQWTSRRSFLLWKAPLQHPIVSALLLSLPPSERERVSLCPLRDSSFHPL